ncbi:hypothetical protein K458DRAFT_162629 [Lentithecium fluviatile CBS 122367]|uniref:Small EDRK-rich factor-like N-terminal domain-containing protein n=1 Tax=Lentithecium fluviatile CBS 122367 TaxID=1168545 RepID=A0A6G1IGH7_9PLEO|nr:hypothetical protein K458DRAFT_162629 [Lentithecium fluviatile CBS 122367]
MARGNQRDKAREKNLKKAAEQKSGNKMSGTEFAKAKEDTAAIMRAKQAAGKSSPLFGESRFLPCTGGQQEFQMCELMCGLTRVQPKRARLKEAPTLERRNRPEHSTRGSQADQLSTFGVGRVVEDVALRRRDGR